MPKAKASKENLSEVEEEEPIDESAEEADDEGKPKKKKAKAAEEPDKPKKKRREQGEEPVRPVLTALRPAKVDHGEAAHPGHDERPPAATLPPAPEVPIPVIEVPKEGAPMQAIKLNDLKRMKITELAKMAHELEIEGYQGLKKQELIF